MRMRKLLERDAEVYCEYKDDESDQHRQTYDNGNLFLEAKHAHRRGPRLQVTLNGGCRPTCEVTKCKAGTAYIRQRQYVTTNLYNCLRSIDSGWLQRHVIGYGF